MKQIKNVTNYQIVRKIASGGMGAVYEAKQDGVEGFSKTVAIKALLAKVANSSRAVEMFIQEAKLVADLVHENIVQIYQLSKVSENYYIVMEYVNGLSLHEFIRWHVKEQQTIPPEIAVFIASRIARGLAYAHSRLDDYGRPMNIVHRDVSTKNVLVTTEGLPKLADFGLALVQQVEKGEKQKKVLVGKLPYMPPEQARGERVDLRSDIFSLGAILFEMLSLKKIRSSKKTDEHLSDAQAGLVEWNLLGEQVSEELLAILESALANNAEERLNSTSAFAEKLERFIYQHGYGPTIQTLEAYMRERFTDLYQFKETE